ncbi:MAG: hypothetical protein M5R41_01225 [Bacteroidia bacterium]|nr:hypothetical protein [Bacteroidia bacterium]
MRNPLDSAESVTMVQKWEKVWQNSAEVKQTYEEKLEGAQGADVFKYIVLINISALEGYVTQSRLQAQQSFNLSKGIAVAGFVLLSIAILLSIVLTSLGRETLNAAYLSGIAGVLTEFIAGVFFLLYSRTLGQINLFHDKLVDMQKMALQQIAALPPTHPVSTSPDDLEQSAAPPAEMAL